MSLRQIALLLFPTHLRVGGFVVGVTWLTTILTLISLTCTTPLSESNSTCRLGIDLIGISFLLFLCVLVRVNAQAALFVACLWLFATSWLTETSALAVGSFLKRWL